MAGPRGVGKTTFIGRLLEGTLSSDVRDLLPRQVSAWPTVEASHWRLVRADAAGPPDGVLVHYDLMRRLRHDDFASDPATEIFDKGRKITVLNLHSQPLLVERQFVVRSFSLGASTTISWASVRRAAYRAKHSSVSHAPAMAFPNTENRIPLAHPSFNQNDWHIISGYFYRRWLDSLVAEWLEFLETRRDYCDLVVHTLRPSKRWFQRRYEWVRAPASALLAGREADYNRPRAT